MTEIVGEISTATHEQSQGLGSINQAAGLEEMTQRNAALVEGPAAACGRLADAGAISRYGPAAGTP